MFQSTQPMRVTMTSVLQTVAGITIRKIILFFGALALSAMPSLGQIVETYPVVFSNTVGFSNVVLATHTTSSNCPSDNNVPNAFFVRTQLGNSTNAAFQVMDSAGQRLGYYTNFDDACTAAPNGSTIENLKPGDYNWAASVYISNNVTVIGNGGLTLSLTNRATFNSTTFKTNTFKGIAFNVAYTQNYSSVGAAFYVNGGIAKFEHCSFSHSVTSDMPAIGLNGVGAVYLKDTILNAGTGVIRNVDSGIVNDFGGSVWNSTTVNTTNYYGNSLNSLRLGNIPASQYLTNCTTYGQLFMDETQEQNLDATYKPITNMLSTNLLNVTAPVSAASNLTPVVAGMYFCAFNIGFAGGVGEEYEFAIFVNNVEENNIQTQRKTSSADIGSAGGSGLLNLSANAVVDLRAKSLDAAADFDPIKVQLILHRLN